MTTFKCVEHRLRRLCRTWKVTVHIVDPDDIDGDLGECEYVGKKAACIRIARNQSEQSRVESLLHEFAHVLAGPCKRDHGRKWGIAYAKCYCCAMRVR